MFSPLAATFLGPAYIPPYHQKEPTMAYKNAPFFSHFQEIRKLNPNEYYTPKTQAQMAAAFQQHGPLFFDLKGYSQ